jgi:hypothetical protein
MEFKNAFVMDAADCKLNVCNASGKPQVIHSQFENLND